MKLTNNNKILLGLAIGGGIAWLLTRKKSATNTSTTSTTSNTSNTVKPKDLTREEKIDFIIGTIEPNATEEKTGFSGERFEYDPKLGYALPIGTVDVVSAGGEIVLPREGNLAQEVFFNADGEPTSDPTDEAEDVLDELTDEQLNVAFKVAQARVNNPNVTDDAIIEISNLGQRNQEKLELIKQKLNDLKALSRNSLWKIALQRRNKRRRELRKELMSMTKAERRAYRKKQQDRRKSRQQRRASRQRKQQRFQARQQRRGQSMGQPKPLFGGGNKRPRFTDEVVNRKKGSMWGGYRNDGKPKQSPYWFLRK